MTDSSVAQGNGRGVALMLSIGMLIVLAYILAGAPHQAPPTNAMTRTNMCAPTYQQCARNAAHRAGINPDVFVRQIQQESGFNPRALSSAGAEGIAQFMPATAHGLGIDPWNAPQALQAAAQLMGRYSRAYGSYALALAAYNAGPGWVTYCLRFANWFSCLPAETRNYIRVIMET